MSTYFKRDRAAIGNILKNDDALQRVVSEYADSILTQVKASFRQEFGFEGSFKLAVGKNKNRFSYKISADNAKTAIILKKHPGWLDSFTR